MKCFVVDDEIYKKTVLYFLKKEKEKEFLKLTIGDKKKSLLADTIIEIDKQKNIKILKKGGYLEKMV